MSLTSRSYLVVPGDAYLKYLSSIYLFVTFPTQHEGALHRIDQVLEAVAREVHPRMFTDYIEGLGDGRISVFEESACKGREYIAQTRALFASTGKWRMARGARLCYYEHIRDEDLLFDCV